MLEKKILRKFYSVILSIACLDLKSGFCKGYSQSDSFEGSIKNGR